MLTAHQVLSATFSATKFREGYDQDEVDDFLDRVVATLRAREAGSALGGAVTVADVDGLRFQLTKFREGYDMTEVDALLDRVRETLGGTAPGVGQPPGGPVSGFLEARPSGWRRFFGG
ncbi:DivIVA domain-containing protein [Cellulomonas sp. URHB0016]